MKYLNIHISARLTCSMPCSFFKLLIFTVSNCNRDDLASIMNSLCFYTNIIANSLFWCNFFMYF